MTVTWSGVFGLILLALIMQPALTEDWPDCKFQCRANDVIVSRLWLGDERGADLISAVAGENQSCFLWATFRNNANTPRYAAILLADLYLNGTFSRSFYDDGLCVLDEIDAKSSIDYPLHNIIWTRGEEIRLKRLVLSWETAKGTICSQANRKCSNRNTKCYGGRDAELFAQTPLFASFIEGQPDCTGAAKFIDRTTGGIGPYSYDWDFDDGFHSTEKNPVHTYNSPGNYTVRLQARDGFERVSSASRTIVFHLCPCTIIGQAHPCLSKTENYMVTFDNSIHSSIRWYLDGREIEGEEAHEEESIDINWQNYGAGRHDLVVYLADETIADSSKPRAACNMTITVTPEPDAVISWVV